MSDPTNSSAPPGGPLVRGVSIGDSPDDSSASSLRTPPSAPSMDQDSAATASSSAQLPPNPIPAQSAPASHADDVHEQLSSLPIPITPPYADEGKKESSSALDESENDEPTCIICQCSGSTSESGRLFRPCRCSGSMLIHESCLQQWRQSSYNEESAVRCSVCHYQYKLERPMMARLLAHPVTCVALTTLSLAASALILSEVAHKLGRVMRPTSTPPQLTMQLRGKIIWRMCDRFTAYGLTIVHVFSRSSTSSFADFLRCWVTDSLESAGQRIAANACTCVVTGLLGREWYLVIQRRMTQWLAKWGDQVMEWDEEREAEENRRAAAAAAVQPDDRE